MLDPSRLTLLVIQQDSSKTEAPAEVRSLGPMNVHRICSDGQVGPNADRFRAVFSSAHWVLVRPDGYVALSGTEDAEPHVSTWEAQWFVAR